MAESSCQVLLVSDAHLGLGKTEHLEQLQKLRQWIDQASCNPSALIVTGDLSDHGADDQADLKFAKTQLETLGLPAYFIPGNHDLGNKMGCEDPITAPRLERWLDVFDSDRFTLVCGDWTLIGLDTQIMGSGFDREQEQWIWLDEQLEIAQSDGQNVAMCLHMPPYLRQKDEWFDGPSDYWTVAPQPRAELLKRLDHASVKLIVNGHAHWHWIGQYHQVPWIWMLPLYPLIVDDPNYPRESAGPQIGGAMMFDLKNADPSYERIDLEPEPHRINWPHTH